MLGSVFVLLSYCDIIFCFYTSLFFILSSPEPFLERAAYSLNK